MGEQAGAGMLRRAFGCVKWVWPGVFFLCRMRLWLVPDGSWRSA